MTIASALDKLNDKLAGSDQPAAQTIEGMILRIIDNIDQGGGGSGGGGLVVHYSDTPYTLDATAGDILDVFAAGGQVVLYTESSDSSGYYSLICIKCESSTYRFFFDEASRVSEYNCVGLDGYPGLDDGE